VVLLLFLITSNLGGRGQAETQTISGGPAAQNSDVNFAPAQGAKDISISIDPGEPFGLALKGGVDRYNFADATKTAEVTDAEVDKFYEENKAQIPRPKEQVAPQIKQYLQQQRRRDAGDPQVPRSARVEWGMKQDAVNDLLKPPAGSKAFQSDRGLSCSSQKNGVAICFPNVAAPWYADFGESFQWSMDPFLRFTPDGKFFAFSLSFHENAFEDTKRTLLARLGKPKNDKPSTVQNRMGATFDQEVVEWKTAHTRVLLIQRSPSDLTKGLLEVAHLPLETSLPPEPTASAPF
jgi:hypothetical protein